MLNSNASDVLQALSVWPTVGRPCVPATIQSLNGTVFSASRGARRGDDESTSVASIVIIVTDADSPFDYSSWTNAGISARRAGLNVFVVGVGDAPISVVMTSIAGNGADHVLRIDGPGSLAPVADQLLTTLCQS